MTRVAHALAEPLPRLPARRPGSIRRTSHVDVVGLSDGGLSDGGRGDGGRGDGGRGDGGRGDGGRGDGGLELTGAAHEGNRTASCRAVLRADRVLTSLTLAPEDPECAALVGRLVGRGFRSLVDEVCEPGTLPWGLLTELPVVALLSGYGTLYSGQLAAPVTDRFIRGVPVDICAGWAGTGFMMEHIKAEHEVPTPDGPDVPLDSAGWHAMPDLAPGALRRQRLIERTGNEIWAMFRDSYARPDGATSVLHEYTVSATISGIDPDDHPSDDPDGDAGDRRSSERISACEATPRVLPWSECPGAAASAGRLVGQRVVDLRSLVRDEFMGTSTCTHLNDLLSSLFQASRLF